jgi:YD repeat-containing protein
MFQRAGKKMVTIGLEFGYLRKATFALLVVLCSIGVADTGFADEDGDEQAPPPSEDAPPPTSSNATSDRPGADPNALTAPFSAAVSKQIENDLVNRLDMLLDAVARVQADDSMDQDEKDKELAELSSEIGDALHDLAEQGRSRALLAYEQLPPEDNSDPKAVYVLGNQPPFSVDLGPVNLLFAGARVDLWIENPAQGVEGPTAISVASGWLPDPHFNLSFGGAGGSSWSSKAVLKSDLYLDIFPASVVSCRCHIIPRHQADPFRPDERRCYCDDDYVYRYRTIDARGTTHVFVQTPSETGAVSHVSSTDDTNFNYTYDPLPTQFWSDNGQMRLDVSNPCLPVVHYPDGSTEEFHAAGLSPDTAGTPYSSFYHPPFPNFDNYNIDGRPNPLATPSCDQNSPLRRVDRNGNVTTFTFPDTNTRVLQDPQGRTVTVTFVPNPSKDPASPLLSSVTIDGPGKVPQTYTVNWVMLTVSAGSGFDLNKQPIVGSAFPDISLVGQYGPNTGTVASGLVPVVQSITIPDGRAYAFEYGPWGNLTRVARPEGSVLRYEYGSNKAPASYAAAVLPLVNPEQVGSGNACGGAWGPPWDPILKTFQEYGVVSETHYPQGDGPSRPGYKTTTDYTKVDLGTCAPDAAGAATTGPQCCVQVWRAQTFPDGSVHRKGMCAASARYYGDLKDGVVPQGWTLGDEVRSSEGSLLSGDYEGVPSSGQLSSQYEVGPARNPSQCSDGAQGAIVLDQRTVRATHVKDGVGTTNTFSFGDWVDVGGGTFRNTANPTATCLWLGDATSCAQGTGTKMDETDTSYLHNPGYGARNLLRLVSNTQTLDRAGAVVTQHSISYDEAPLTPSQQPGLDSTYTNGLRGNPTTARAYLTPASGSGPVDTKTYYFDNGATYATKDPNQANGGSYTTLTTAFNFGTCASNPALRTTMVNAMGHATTTVVDCYSRLTLSTTDPNGQTACSQYDGLGRNVETAGPGDTLSAQPLCTSTSGGPSACYVRDPAGCAASGTAIGNGGNGPTTWTDYFLFGLNGTSIDSARTVVHVKDGSPRGKYVKTFADGLGRPVASCSNIDPSTSDGANGNNEVCTYKTYDAMGHLFQQYSPSYASDVQQVQLPTGVPYTQTCYDPLDRPTLSAFVWAGAFACGAAPPTSSFVTNTSYSGTAGGWVTTTTSPNRNDSRSVTDALGHAIESDQFLCASSPCTAGSGTQLATTMAYDVVGRLLSVTDPLGNVISFGYDGLGRKTSMQDPDMGTWTYSYDPDGNLVRQIDGKGQTITMYYDDLDRLTIKDLPPAGQDSGDVVNTYDGVMPTCAPTASCGGATWTRTSTAVCCDDRDPGTTDSCDTTTATCNARANPLTGACGTPRAQCAPGATLAVPCGNCGSGTAVETCTEACTWGPPGACFGDGCAPGSTRSESCGNCGTEVDTCTSSCTWSAGACTGQGVCAAGATRSSSCGNCGQETDTCSASCQWSPGSCTGQGCTPGSTRQVSCGNCGLETDTCSPSCQWSASSCTGQGPCGAGTTRSESCTDGFGDVGTETDSCTASCQWSTGTCVVCGPGGVQSCDPDGICSSCNGSCTMGTQHCGADGTWGACSGANCTGCNPGTGNIDGTCN